MSFLKPYTIFHDATLLYIFLAQTLHTFDKSSLSKFKFSDFPLLELKFTKFFMLFFKQKLSFSSKFGSVFTVMRGNSSVFFQLKLYMLLTKVAHQKCKFSDLSLLALKFTKFPMSFLEPRVNFSSYFASLSSVMRDNSSVLFNLKLYLLRTKGAYQRANLQTSDCLDQN